MSPNPTPHPVYRFMELANHQAAVNSSRGAAFGCAQLRLPCQHACCMPPPLLSGAGSAAPPHRTNRCPPARTPHSPRGRFASIARLAGERLGPHIARIIPRLYRFLYDPNGKVRDAMGHIWHALLDDPKASVTQNFDGTVWCGWG